MNSNGHGIVQSPPPERQFCQNAPWKSHNLCQRTPDFPFRLATTILVPEPASHPCKLPQSPRSSPDRVTVLAFAAVNGVRLTVAQPETYRALTSTTECDRYSGTMAAAHLTVDNQRRDRSRLPSNHLIALPKGYGLSQVSTSGQGVACAVKCVNSRHGGTSWHFPNGLIRAPKIRHISLGGQS